MAILFILHRKSVWLVRRAHKCSAPAFSIEELLVRHRTSRDSLCHGFEDRTIGAETRVVGSIVSWGAARGAVVLRCGTIRATLRKRKHSFRKAKDAHLSSGGVGTSGFMQPGYHGSFEWHTKVVAGSVLLTSE